MKIDSERLWQSLMRLAEVGAYRDDATGLTGVNRLALTDADGRGRQVVKQWFEDAGLAVRVDRIGNVYGRRAGTKDLAPVLCGSHIDSVPTGGAFDGALGVLGALEVVRTLQDAGAATQRPVEIGFFTDEEGARFGTDMLGSAVAVGRLPLEQAYALADAEGLTVKGELERIGFLGPVPERVLPPHAYVECHIEQGPILAAEGMDLGVVTGVQAISWWDVTMAGRSAHAGTTPMKLRADTAVAAARVIVGVNEMATGGNFGDQMRATVGGLSLHPGLVNIVPGRARLTVDLRNPADEHMAAAEKALHALFSQIEREMGVKVEARQTARTPRIHFSTAVQAIMARHMDAAGHRHMPIISGAGHDAQEFSSICPTAMIFVPGEHDGISHNPREFSTQQACAAGVQMLLQTVLELSGEDSLKDSLA